MASSAENLVDEYCIKLITIDAPSWYNSVQFRIVLLPVLSQLSTAMPLQLAPGLHNVLQAPTPQGISFFEALPEPRYGCRCVYAIIMRKAGC